jgi:histone deacetylase 1/2
LGHIASKCFKRFKREFLGVGNDGGGASRQVAAAIHAPAPQGYTPSYPIDPAWYADTGATDHLTNDLDKLTVREPYNGNDQVHTANGAGMRIHHVGQGILPTPSHNLRLNDVLHVPSVTRNLLSVKKLTHDNPVFVEIHPNDIFVKDRATREIMLRGRSRGGLYPLEPPIIKQAFGSVRASQEQWHCRLGHPASQVVKHVLHHSDLPSKSSHNNAICDACQQGKSHQLPFSLSSHVIKAPLELIFSDVWGPAQVSVSGHT